MSKCFGFEYSSNQNSDSLDHIFAAPWPALDKAEAAEYWKNSSEIKNECKIEEYQVNLNSIQTEHTFVKVEPNPEARDSVNILENVTSSISFSNNYNNRFIKKENDFMLPSYISNETNWQEQFVKAENIDQEEINKILEDTKTEINENPFKKEAENNIDVLSEEGIENTEIASSCVVISAASKNRMLIKPDDKNLKNRSKKSDDQDNNSYKITTHKNKKDLLLIPAEDLKLLFECQECHKKLASKQGLDGHIVSKHGMNKKAMTKVSCKVYSCEMCEYKTIANNIFKTHIETHKGVEADKKFQCNICPFKTIHQQYINVHMKKHAGLCSFSCEICGKKLASRTSLNQHYVSKHPTQERTNNIVTRKFHSCNICPFRSGHSSKLKIHLQTHTSVELDHRFKCDKCSYKTLMLGNFKRHLQSHTGISDFGCQICAEKFKSKRNLDIHILAKHPENEQAMTTVTNKIHNCKMCDYKTVGNYRFTIHLQKHKGTEADKQYQCDICGHKTIRKNNLKDHIKRHQGSAYTCELCGRNFNYKHSLDNHIVLKHSENEEAMATVTNKIHFCGVCKFKTVHYGNLKIHSETHMAVKPDKKFKCDKCEYKTMRKSKFKTHVQYHQGLIEFSCQVCSKNFGSKRSLDFHILAKHPRDEQVMLTVTSKVHSCNECDYKTIDNFRFEIHVQKHNGICADRKYQCDICGHSIMHKNILKAHIKSHAEILAFICPICNKKFGFKHSLDDHIVLEHTKNEKAEVKISV